VPEDNAQQVIARAHQLSLIGRDSAAAELLGPYLATHPEDAEALRLMAHVQLALGRPELALSAAERAARLSPGDAEPLVTLSYVLRAAGRVLDARAAVEEARRLDPLSVRVLSAWISAHLGVGSIGNWGRRRRLLEASEELLRIAPDEAVSHHMHALVRQDLGQPRRADAAYRRARALDPSDPLIRQNHAVLDIEMNRFGSALASNVTRLATEPDSRIAMFHLRATVNQMLRIVWIALFVVGNLAVRIVDLQRDFARIQSFIGWSAAVLWILVIIMLVHTAATSRGAFLRAFRSLPRVDLALTVTAATFLALLLGLTAFAIAPSFGLVVAVCVGYLLGLGALGWSWLGLRRTREELERAGEL